MICTLFTGQTSKEGLFIRYSYEFKLMCIEMYRQGRWTETPDGVSTKTFRDTILKWNRIEMHNGPDALKHTTDVSQFNFSWGKCYLSPILDMYTKPSIILEGCFCWNSDLEFV